MSKGRTFIRETVYVAGDYIDGDIYPVYQPAGKRRKRCKPTTEIQTRINQRNAERKLIRLVRQNFSNSDLAVTLTYRTGAEPLNEEDAKRSLSNYLKRLRRYYASVGVILKYITCTEYGKTTGRCHHHLILSGGVSRDKLEELWDHGFANSKRLQMEEDGAEGLSRYMAKNETKISYRRWNQSRNLEIPERAEYDGRINVTDEVELAKAVEDGIAHRYFEDLYPGYEVTDYVTAWNPINRAPYIHLEMKKRRR